MKNIEIFVDMDGVLADFDGRIETVPELKQARASVKSMSKNLESKLNKPYGPNWHYKDLELILRGPQTDPDLQRLKNKLKHAKNKIFEFASREGFFIGLEKMVDADILIDGIINLTGKKPNILSAPLDSSKTCRIEKKEWIQTYYSDKIDKFYLEKDKFKFAAPNHVLIDDTPKKIRPFREAGGLGILHLTAKDTLEQLKTILK